MWVCIFFCHFQTWSWNFMPKRFDHWFWNLKYLLELAFCFQNCSDILWEKIVLVIKKNVWNLRLNVKNFEMTRQIHSNNEMSVQFLKLNTFSTCSWRFLISNELEQLTVKWKKITGIKKSTEKVKIEFWRQKE